MIRRLSIGIDVTPLVQEKLTGVQLIAKYLVESLVKEYPHHTFVLFAWCPRARKRHLLTWQVFTRSNVKAEVVPIPARWFHDSATFWQRIGYPPVELFTGQVDIFHSFDWFCFKSLAPQTNTIYDLTPHLFPQWHTQENRDVFDRRMRAVINHSRKLLAISHHTKEDVIAQYHYPPDNIEVIYPDCSPLFTPLPQKQVEKVQKTQALPPEYFLFVSTLEPRKNVSRLVETYLTLREKGLLSTPLVMVGSVGWKIEAAIKRFNAEKDIIRLGYIDNTDLPALYQAAKGLLYPSLYEGFGIPILEALRCGCPVLTSHSSSMPEVGGEAVIYCDPYRKDSIGEGILRLEAMTKDERKAFIIKAKKQSASFSYVHSARKMMAVWVSLSHKA